MAAVNSPNMTLPIPAVGSTPGPDYALDVNSSLTLIDQHDHSPGKGVQITPAGLNINDTLSMQNNALTNIQQLIFTEQPSISDLQSLYIAPGGESPSINDLFYNDSAGNIIQLTKAGTVNATIASIPGESYAAGTFTWTQAQDALPTTPANFDIGSITIRPNIALTTFGVTLAPPGSIASAYTLNLPTIPGSTSFLTIPNTGAIASTISYPISAKGDLMVGTSGANLAKLGAGSDGQVLTADSTATNGLSYQNATNAKIVTKTSNYTLTSADSTILVDASGGSFTITLPAASSVPNQKFVIKRTDAVIANQVTISGTIDGASDWKLYTQNETLGIQSDGTNYSQIQHDTEMPVLTSTTVTLSTGSFGTTTTKEWRLQRSGNYLIGQLVVVQTVAGTGGSGEYHITMPVSLSIDTAIAPTSNSGTPATGKCLSSLDSNASIECNAGAAVFFAAQFCAVDATTLRVIGSFFAGASITNTLIWGSGNATLANNSTNALITFRIPILGWKP
jgi:hypothetical protein